MARNIFIDCGTHYGEGLRQVAQRLGIDASWEVHCFEPNPECSWYFAKERILEGPSVHFHATAVWICDGTVGLRQENHALSQTESPVFGGSPIDGWGSTIMADSVHPALQEPIGVPCVDLSRFIRENTREGDRVVVKLDVEGAEYAILRKMIEERSLDLVQEMYVEFHSRFLPSESAESTERLKDEIRQAFPRLRFLEWE